MSKSYPWGVLPAPFKEKKKNQGRKRNQERKETTVHIEKKYFLPFLTVDGSDNNFQKDNLNSRFSKCVFMKLCFHLWRLDVALELSKLQKHI